jgi:hypothetical protein
MLKKEARWLTGDFGCDEPTWHGHECVENNSQEFPDCYGLLFRLIRKVPESEVKSISIDGRILIYRPECFPEGSQPEDVPFPNEAKITSLSRLCAVTWKSLDMAVSRRFFGAVEHRGTASCERV